jgi:hypothetical protein
VKPPVEAISIIPAPPKLPDLDLKSPKGPTTISAPVVDNKAIESNRSSENVRKPQPDKYYSRPPHETNIRAPHPIFRSGGIETDSRKDNSDRRGGYEPSYKKSEPERR